MMKIHFLGTNGWYDSPTGNTICVAIETEALNVILDCGLGISKLDQFISFNKPSYLFLSHLHLDHIYGIHLLIKFPFQKELPIFVPAGQSRELKKLLQPPFTADGSFYPFKLSLKEMPEDLKMLPFPVHALPLYHPVPTMGVRIQLEGKTIVYCTDTGYCENAVTLSKDADLLITECSYLPGEEETQWPHLNPKTAASIAKEAGAKQLILTHFDASRYLSHHQRELALVEAQQVFKNTLIANDGLSLQIV